MLKSKIIPKTILKRDSYITLTWEHVFPENNHENLYYLDVYDIIYDWKPIYWGQKTTYTIHGLNPNTCFDFRIRQKCNECFSSWIEFKAATETDQIYVSHLCRAIKSGKVPLIRRIITQRPHLLETENKVHKTPLMQATEVGDLIITTFLLTLGANLNAQTLITKRTSLMMAIFLNHLNVAQLFIDKGADISLSDVNGMNILHYAIDSDNLENVKFVLNLEFLDIDSVDNKGWSALLRAVIMNSSDEIIMCLLKKGANIKVKDCNGYDFDDHIKLVQRDYLLNDIIKYAIQNNN